MTVRQDLRRDPSVSWFIIKILEFSAHERVEEIQNDVMCGKRMGRYEGMYQQEVFELGDFSGEVCIFDVFPYHLILCFIGRKPC